MYLQVCFASRCVACAWRVRRSPVACAMCAPRVGCVIPGNGAVQRAFVWVRGSLHSRAVVVHMRACHRADVRGCAVRPLDARYAHLRWLVRARACAVCSETHELLL